MDTLIQQLTDWKPFTALVVGDFMLDHNVYGDAERLSADAPVPILHVKHEKANPGGAANVCLDLIALKARVVAFGVTGDDAHGQTLRAAMQKEGVDTAGLLTDAARPTTVKQNFIGLAQQRHPQKMFRVDYESREPLAAEVVDRLVRAFEKALATADVVCMEDYAKGVCTPELCQRIIRAARAAGKPVFVDPAKIADYGKYKGAAAITPNRTEAEFATGLKTDGAADLEHNAQIARRLLDQVELESVILTLDRHGALLLERGHDALAVSTIAREVYDVTGAGDMFLAALAAARANRVGWEDAVRFANAAAGLEVEIFGVEPIPFERIRHSLLDLAGKLTGKLRSREQLLVEVDARRRAGQRIVFTNGCFDVLHAGHVTLLEKAAKLGDYLIVAINDDASVHRLKGPGRPVNHADDRVKVLSALGCIGAIVVFAEDTPIDLIRAVKPDILAKGADYSKDKVVGADVVEANNGRVELIDLVEGRSTTATIAKIARKSAV